MLNIPFDINMLKWKKGGRTEDGIWSKHWYKNAHNSTGFFTKNQKTIKISKEKKDVLAELYYL